MQKRTPSFLSLLLLITSFFSSLSTQAQTTRVLFIGNSYTFVNDLPGMFVQLAGSMGETVVTGMSAPGGYTFQGHTTLAATQNLIAQGDWDMVVLQEQSQLPSFSPTQVAAEVYPYATQLVQQVHAANPCTEVVFLMTWGRENGDAQNCGSYPPLCTYDGMQQRLRDSYVAMAMDNSVECAPAGAVWRAYRNEFPTALLYTDQSHPNVTGTYIASCTLFSSIFRRSCVGATYVPAGTVASDAQTIRGMASAIVADSSGTWNLGVNDPVADFSYNESAPGSFQFTNNTITAVAQTWSFGDGSTSDGNAPTHTYTSSGTFPVTLFVTDNCGRADSTTLDVTVSITGIADLGTRPSLQVVITNGMASVQNCSAADRFELLDLSGRTLFTRLLRDHTDRFSVPMDLKGAFLYRVSNGSGTVHSGRCVIM